MHITMRGNRLCILDLMLEFLDQVYDNTKEEAWNLSKNSVKLERE